MVCATVTTGWVVRVLDPIISKQRRSIMRNVVLWPMVIGIVFAVVLAGLGSAWLTANRDIGVDVCKRVVFDSIDQSKGLYAPHWHLVPGDVVSKRDGKTTILFASGRQISGPEQSMIVIDEVCR